ncbi:MAG: glycosyltransferase 87 family protein, partial [Candidatus Binatia bacterium]
MDERLAWRTNGLPFGTNYDPSAERFFIQDFASIFALTKAVVSGAIGEPYGAEGQLQFMERWVGHRVGVALGYGYSPTLWLILSPLLPLPAPLAYVLWSLLPALALFGIGWRLVAKGWSERNPLALTLIVIALASGCYQSEVQLGQTTVVLGLITFWLISTASDPKREALTAFLLFLLTAKPPLALAMGVGLLWNRQAKPVLVAMGLVVLEVACVTWWLGFGWMADYWELLTHYTSDTAPEAFRHFFRPVGMSNLRHLLVSGAGWSDRAASSASVAGWAAAIACGTWLARRGRLPAGRLRLAFALLLYSLFSPHLTSINDLLVVIVVWFLHSEVKLGSAARAAAAGALVVVVNVGPLKTLLLNEAGAHLALLGKVGILVLFLATSMLPKDERDRGTPVSDRTHRAAGFLFLALSCFYLLCSTGYVNGPDGAVMLRLTAAFADGRTWIDPLPDWPDFGGLAAPDRAGHVRFHPWFAPGLSLAAIPAYLAGRRLSALAPDREEDLFDVEGRRARDDPGFRFRVSYYDTGPAAFREAFTAFASSWTTAFAAAGAVAFLFLVSIEIGFPREVALGVALLSALASPLWV